MTPLVVGAAMRSALLDTYLEWILTEQRDVEIQDAASVEILDGDWRSHANAIKAKLNGHTGRLGIHGPFMSLPTAAQDPAIREVVTRRLRQGIEFCAAIGGTHMVVHSPFYTSLGKPFAPYTDTVGHEFALDLAHQTLDAVVPMATDAGCTLMLENIHDLTPGPLLALVKSYDSPTVRMSIDTGHAFIAHALLGAMPPDLWVKEAGARLGHVHLQDTDGYLDRHWIPGDGNIKWPVLFRELSALEPTPRLIIEVVDQGGAVLDAAGWLVERGLAR